MAIVDATRRVTGGVDTHLDFHVAAALDQLGGTLGVQSFATTRPGYKGLLEWLLSFGEVATVGVEGTGAYGAGLARYLAEQGVTVLEVDRPNRMARRRWGKSDPTDAIEAARAALGGRSLGQAKSRNGGVEAIRALVVAKRSAKESRNRALNQIRHLGFTGPDELKHRFHGLSVSALTKKAATLRPVAGADQVAFATKLALRCLGRRVRRLDEEIALLDEHLSELVTEVAPELAAVAGVGVETASQLLVAAGDNPERLRSEAAFARLCGVSPIEASSGKVTRHRLNRGGDRQANMALWRIVLVRMSCDPRTRAYVERRTKEGRSKREIIRVLKRYVAREVYRYLPRP